MDDVQSAVMDWIATGETGASSKTMAFWLAFDRRMHYGSHPLDPADLDRCLKLLCLVSALRKRLPKMAEVSSYWAALVARWDELEQCHLDEVGIGWSKARSAPKTYALMKEILRPIERSDPSVVVIGGMTVSKR